MAIWDKAVNRTKFHQIDKSFYSSWSSWVMYGFHALNSIEMTLTQTSKSATNHIFTSSASISMVSELYWTLFHSHDSFMWALTSVMEYCRIMSLVMSKPYYSNACLICSMYALFLERCFPCLLFLQVTLLKASHVLSLCNFRRLWEKPRGNHKTTFEAGI